MDMTPKGIEDRINSAKTKLDLDHLTRGEAVGLVGVALVDKLDSEGADSDGDWPIFDQCVADAGLLQQSVTYTARVKIEGDREDWFLEAVYYQPYDAASNCEALDDLNWSIDHYRIVD